MLSAPVQTEWTLQGGLLVEPRLAALGLRHGMTTLAWGDMAEPARRAVLEPVAVLRQEHKATIHEANPGAQILTGDGLVSRIPGLAVGVFTADCVPLLLWTDDGRVVGAFHAGWRGLVAGMGRAAVAAMTTRDINAAIGPHIGSCCYTVGDELRSSFPAERFERRGANLHLDLAAEARAQLAAAGVAAERVQASALCTSCRPDLFSWRRDRVRRNMLVFLAPL